MTRRIVVALATGALLGAPAAAPAAAVDLMVVGKARTLAGPESVTLRTQKPRVGRSRCTVGARTPLAALLRARPRLEVTLRDYGACGRSSRDAAGLFVSRIGPDRNRGQAGWVYKVGRRLGTTGAADPAGAFGDGRRLRDGRRVLWFYCVRAGDSCQRSLEVSPAARRVPPGRPLRVTVRGYDDLGRGVRVEGATVRLGEQTAVTGAGGVATITPAAGAAGTLALSAERDGAIPSFPREVAVK